MIAMRMTVNQFLFPLTKLELIDKVIYIFCWLQQSYYYQQVDSYFLTILFWKI